ncbi:GPW/gp25 family protein [Streptomyces sp.]|uniref:GPW/gp25 family protein n=1 Tax=Streptomyces sp. TaxID=1931 RepID=UPI002811D7D9|nr:GPW/gp25 family protein [Streptomyces sp.]
MRFGFPLRLDARGRLATVDDEEYLRGLVEAVLFTRPGERVNRPDFGSGVDRLVFAPSGDELAGATQSLVQAAVQQWLSDLLRVHEVRVEARDAVLDVTIRYTPLGQEAAEPRVLRLTGRGTP